MHIGCMLLIVFVPFSMGAFWGQGRRHTHIPTQQNHAHTTVLLLNYLADLVEVLSNQLLLLDELDVGQTLS